MQEEIARQAQSKAVMLSVYTSRLTAQVLRAAIRAYLQDRAASGGEKSLRELMSEGMEVKNIEVSAAGIGDFGRVARKYGVRYAIKKCPAEDGETPRYLVFFRARDADVLNAALNEYTQEIKRGKEPPPILKALRAVKDAALHHERADRGVLSR